MLQIREALVLVDDELAAIAQALATLARQHRLTPVIGRSNLQQAIPVTFGYKMAGILSAVLRHRDASRNCVNGCWWANSPVPPARRLRWKPGPWKHRRRCVPNWACSSP